MDWSSSMATVSFTWSDDVLTEILLRLPAKSLVRFKLVCKSWFSIISSHQFCHLHTHHHPKPEPSFILQPQTTADFFYFHPLQSERLTRYHFSVPNPKILSSSHGLLLLESDTPHKDYFVYNPTTKKSRHIILKKNDMDANVLGLNLAFDPSKSPYYRIICIRATRKTSSVGDRCCQIEVYNSKTHTWKLSLESFPAYRATDFTSGVHWNNAVHWPNHPRTFMYFEIDKNEVRNLPYTQVPWPLLWRENGGGAACHCQLQEANGYLHHFIIVSGRGHGDTSIAVLELQDHYSQWVLRYNDGHGFLPGKTRTLCFVRDDKRETDTLVYHVPGKITAYKFMDRSSKEIDLTTEAFYRENTVLFEPRHIHLFGETLAPI